MVSSQYGAESAKIKTSKLTVTVSMSAVKGKVEPMDGRLDVELKGQLAGEDLSIRCLEDGEQCTLKCVDYGCDDTTFCMRRECGLLH